MSRAPRSLTACLFILLVLLGIRAYYSDIGGARANLVLTRWDAFGYYLYLPATLIYHDYDKLEWADSIDKRYNVSGGDGLPVQTLENGNRVCKYLGGVALLQSPFFAIGHVAAGLRGDRRDGFSPAYQYALGFGAVLYVFLALLLLRRLLLRWFGDGVVAWTLLLTALATNLPQYAAVDSGLSHVWIIPLYVLVVWTTMRWHLAPKWGWALATGYIIGLATICRPTEAIMLFIPLLWGIQNKAAARQKWAIVRAHRSHIVIAAAGGVLGILPQLLYWKAVTGSAIYDVGSKWVFLNPWFRVLTGWEKGWFIYTPVTLLFIAGLFRLKRYKFRYSVLVFCLLNIWVVISWEDWQYGASYSARALVQSYPLFAMALAALLARLSGVWRPVFYVAACLITALNLFQIRQYNAGIIHHRDMNRAYYSRVFLNPSPSPLDMSLLDVADRPDRRLSNVRTVYSAAAPVELQMSEGAEQLLCSVSVDIHEKSAFFRIQTKLDIAAGRWDSRLGARLRESDSLKELSVRLGNPIGEKTGRYAFNLEVPEGFTKPQLEVFIKPGWDFHGRLMELQIDLLTEN